MLSTYTEVWETLLAHLDLDRDRRVSAAEFTEGMTAAYIDNTTGFDRVLVPACAAVHGLADTDHDGLVTKDEFRVLKTGYGRSAAESDLAFDKIDTRGEGTLTLAEITRAVREYIVSADDAAPGNWLYGRLG